MSVQKKGIHRLAPEKREKVAQMAREGVSNHVLAQEAGVSVSTIYNWRKAGLLDVPPLEAVPAPTEDKEEEPIDADELIQEFRGRIAEKAWPAAEHRDRFMRARETAHRVIDMVSMDHFEWPDDDFAAKYTAFISRVIEVLI